MKNFDLKKFIIGVCVFLLGVIGFYLLRFQNSFVPLFFGVLVLLGGINASSIIFYQSINSKDAILKHIFSFLSLIILLTVTSKLIL